MPSRFHLIRCGFALILVLAGAAWASGQEPADKGKDKDKDQPKKEAKKPSVTVNDKGAYQGYTLIAPLNSRKTFLIDMEGRIVHTWEHDCTPSLVPYLLDNGNLLRPGTVPGSFSSPGIGGRVQEFTWDGKLVWDFKLDAKNQHPHHDIQRLPNGNILMIVSDRKNAAQLLAAGRRSDAIRDVFNADAIIEVKPTGPKSGEVVWEWHVWDHLVQDVDKSKNNFGKVADMPERVDLNYGHGMFGLGRKTLKKEEVDKLKGIGYLGGPDAKNLPANLNADWTHFNSVAYNAEYDQIMISVHAFSEIWIIDHSTTKEEAKGSRGGKYGKGGDLLYRWGNPHAYRSGTNADQRLFHQHNAHWIPSGLPGAGNVLIFNNGLRRLDGNYSSVDEITLPQNKDGSFEPGKPFGPQKAHWSYSAPKKNEFYSAFISGAHRLPNGNTFICSGVNGIVFEVTPQKEVVWKFHHPAFGFGILGPLLGAPAGGLFRSYRFGADHPALKGRNLVPGKRFEEL